MDLVPNAGGTNLARLCDALNGLRPRWRVPGFPGGSRSTEAASNRAISKADSIAVGLVTSIGNIDVVLQLRGFEAGYPALSAHAVRMSVGGVEVHVGGLDDLIVSQRLLRRPEDLDQLPALEEPRDRLRSTGTELADQGSFPEPVGHYPVSPTRCCVRSGPAPILAQLENQARRSDPPDAGRGHLRLEVTSRRCY